ncbi:MAG: adenylate/guanylate cyclase domain-containing protein [Fibrobacterota bacterium]
MKSYLIIFTAVLASLLTACHTRNPGQIEDGVLDLRNHNFAEEPVISLKGFWHFYPGLSMENIHTGETPAPSRVFVPGAWKASMDEEEYARPFGHGTYTVRILLPQRVKKLALSAPHTVSAYSLWVNGVFTNAVGQPGKYAEKTLPRISPRPIHFEADSVVQLSIEVSNFHISTWHIGGGLGNVNLGTSQQMNRNRLTAMFADGMLIGGFLFIALLLILFYGAYRRDSSYLYLSSFILLVTLRFLSTNSKVFFEIILADSVPWTWMQRLEMLGYYGATPLLLLYVYSLFPSSQKKERSFVRLLAAVDVLFILTVVFTPPRIFMYTLDYFHILTFIHMAYVFKIIFRSYTVPNERDAARIVGFSLIIFFTFVTIDILNNSILHGFFRNYAGTQGLIIFVLLQGWLLAQRYMAMYLKVVTSEQTIQKHMKIIELYTRKSIVEYIKKGHNPLHFTPATISTNILISDIRNFTGFSENLSPLKTVEALNRYFNAMSECITHNRGEIDSLTGDCLMALFPNSDDSVNAAVDMRIRLREMNRKNPGFRLHNGIGINFGEVIMGNIGSDYKLDYTVIGPGVTAAGYIETLTKHYNLPILISEEILRVLTTFHHTRFIDRVHMEGSKKTESIFEVYDHEPNWVKKIKKDIQPIHQSAYELLTHNAFSQALKIYENLAAEIGPHTHAKHFCVDPLVNFRIRQCHGMLSQKET